MKYILSTFLCFISVLGTYAQISERHNNPSIPAFNTGPYRTEFISYNAREIADRAEKNKNEYYLPIQFEASADSDGKILFSEQINIPYIWLDREVFLRIEGLPSFYITINGLEVGYGEDSKTPEEFNISSYIKDGLNDVSIYSMNGTGYYLEPETKPEPSVYIFSQPKFRIEDYIVTAELDSAGRFAKFEMKVAIANSYNFDETITIGYDIYTPEKTLKNYNITELTISGKGRDTVVFSEEIYGAKERLWSAETPKLYYGMIYVRRDGRMIEYIPYKVGFGSTYMADGKIYRNNSPISIKAVRYNSSKDLKATSEQLSKLKKEGYNTICPDYPQPTWFYDICENIGLYVIDQANINPTHEIGNKRLGGSYANAPEWNESFSQRMRAMYARNKNRCCIIGWSIGGNIGNGYNMYKSYQLLKDLDDKRAVVYFDAEQEWNNDVAIDLN